MEGRVAEYIAKHQMLKSGGGKVAVALSGGADSVALLALLTAIGYECEALHCNFHLRGAESDRDEAFAIDIAKRFGVKCHVKHFDIDAYRASRSEHPSVEMACREVRYEWFEQMRQVLGCQAIAVAHHKQDNVETFFLNLMRGSGLAGLTGIKPVNGYIIRPLLCCTREEIEDYLRRRGLDSVTDSTNGESDFSRNFLRNEVLPLLRRRFPGADDAVSRTMDILNANRALYLRTVEEARKRYCSGTTIDVRRLAEEDSQAQTLLYEWLAPEGFNASQTADMIASAGGSGCVFTGRDATYVLNRGVLERVDADKIDEQFPFEMTIRPRSEFAPERDENVLYLDAEAFEGDAQIKVRRWQPGDRMEPFGMRGSKKLSDIFNDAGLSVEAKKHVPILTRNGEILWAAGVRASRHFPVTEQTERFITLKYKPKR